MVFMSLRERFYGFGLLVQFFGVLEREFCAYGFSLVLLNFLDFVRYFLGFTNVFNGLVRLDSEWSA